MLSSGTAAIGTAGTGAQTLFTVPAGSRIESLVLINNGVAGSFSIDGVNYAYMPGSATLALYDLPLVTTKTISIKRISASDMSGVYAMAW
jgi:hypothetical protein